VGGGLAAGGDPCGLLDKVLGYFERREQAKLAAANDTERRAMEERADVRATALAIRLATAGHWEMRLITFVIAACFVSHLVLVTWDTNWPQPWNVPSFPSPFDEWEGIIILSFFGVQVANKIANTTAAASVMKAKAVERSRSLLERLSGRDK
jgi:hypothetical protein